MLSLIQINEQLEESALNCLFTNGGEFSSRTDKYTNNYISKWPSITQARHCNTSSFSNNQFSKQKIEKTKQKTADKRTPKFHHFENSHDYVVCYRENITYQAIMEYRRTIETMRKNKKNSQNNTKSCEECPSPSPHCEARRTPFIESNLWKDSPKYTSVYGVNINIIMQSIHGRRERNGCSTPQGESVSPKKRLPSSACIVGENQEKRYNEKYSSPITMHKKKNKTKNTVRLKTGNECQNPLTILSNSNVVIGPRMGSNYPINKEQHNRQLTPSQRYISSLRPRVPQAAIPYKNTSFQACIMPMSV